ncbi:MAG: DUF98 domain-containing protein [Alcanivoracaceae bacterium]|nr:DUF98 domain-containing protein [Alcanivoracaceae bacterium]
MKNLTEFPLALQLLMQTDGTVTELIKLLTQEDIIVCKLSEKITDDNGVRVLDRHIFLQGKRSGKNWLYAQSKIYLDNLPAEFVNDLLEKTIPIGTLWINYRMETFKQLINQYEELSLGQGDSGFKASTNLLTRVYQVFNQYKIIMEITEKFPIDEYENLI